MTKKEQLTQLIKVRLSQKNKVLRGLHATIDEYSSTLWLEKKVTETVLSITELEDLLTWIKEMKDER